jgi:hypothetical protein
LHDWAVFAGCNGKASAYSCTLKPCTDQTGALINGIPLPHNLARLFHWEASTHTRSTVPFVSFSCSHGTMTRWSYCYCYDLARQLYTTSTS